MARLKAKEAFRYAVGIVKFRFQNGAIKSSENTVNNRLRECFDSKMARLKGTQAQKPQAQKACFDSKMARLKAPMKRLRRLWLVRVSIPYWCD